MSKNGDVPEPVGTEQVASAPPPAVPHPEAVRDLGSPVGIYCGACGRPIAKAIAERRGDNVFRLAEYGHYERRGVEFGRGPAGGATDRSLRGPRTGKAIFGIETDDLDAASQSDPALLQRLQARTEVPPDLTTRGFIALLRKHDLMPKAAFDPEVLPGPPGAMPPIEEEGPRPLYVFVCGCGQEHYRKPNRLARALYEGRPGAWTLEPDGRDHPGAPSHPARRHGRRPAV